MRPNEFIFELLTVLHFLILSKYTEVNPIIILNGFHQYLEEPMKNMLEIAVNDLYNDVDENNEIVIKNKLETFRENIWNYLNQQ